MDFRATIPRNDCHAKTTLRRAALGRPTAERSSDLNIAKLGTNRRDAYLNLYVVVDLYSRYIDP